MNVGPIRFLTGYAKLWACTADAGEPRSLHLVCAWISAETNSGEGIGNLPGDLGWSEGGMDRDCRCIDGSGNGYCCGHSR